MRSERLLPLVSDDVAQGGMALRTSRSFTLDAIQIRRDQLSATKSEHEMTTGTGYEGAYIAHLWEYPNLCVAIFGVQFHTEEGLNRYDAAGITEEMGPALESGHIGRASPDASTSEANSGVLLQYWRSYDDLDAWARTLPHMRWWRWLLQECRAEYLVLPRDLPGEVRRSDLRGGLRAGRSGGFHDDIEHHGR